jgi:hypothetical protein
MPPLKIIGPPQSEFAAATHRAGTVNAKPNGLAGIVACTLLATSLAGPAEAEVKSVAPNGFEVIDTVTIQAPPERVYDALGQIGRWWSSAHTFSRDAANLSIDLKADGCFCERRRTAAPSNIFRWSTPLRAKGCACEVPSALCKWKAWTARSPGL